METVNELEGADQGQPGVSTTGKGKPFGEQAIRILQAASLAVAEQNDDDLDPAELCTATFAGGCFWYAFPCAALRGFRWWLDTIVVLVRTLKFVAGAWSWPSSGHPAFTRQRLASWEASPTSRCVVLHAIGKTARE